MADTRCVALLRAVNVGGRKVAMAELRECLGALGYGDVRTYVQSGNAVFSAQGTTADIRTEIEGALRESFGIEIPTAVLTAAELERVVAANPYPDLVDTPTKLVVSFLPDPVPSSVRESFSLSDFAEDGVVGERVIYLSYPDGQGRSKLTAAVLTRRLGGIWGTARNWRTVLALRQLTADPASSSAT